MLLPRLRWLLRLQRSAATTTTTTDAGIVDAIQAHFRQPKGRAAGRQCVGQRQRQRCMRAGGRRARLLLLLLVFEERDALMEGALSLLGPLELGRQHLRLLQQDALGVEFLLVCLVVAF